MFQNIFDIFKHFPISLEMHIPKNRTHPGNLEQEKK